MRPDSDTSLPGGHLLLRWGSGSRQGLDRCEAGPSMGPSSEGEWNARDRSRRVVRRAATGEHRNSACAVVATDENDTKEN